MRNIWETMKFFADHAQARISEEDQQNAKLRDIGSDAEFSIDEYGWGHVYTPLFSTPIVLPEKKD